MTEETTEDARERQQRRHAASRTVQLYALFIVAMGLFNGLLYWERGSVLALVIVVVCIVALVGWLAYARTVIRAL